MKQYYRILHCPTGLYVLEYNNPKMCLIPNTSNRFNPKRFKDFWTYFIPNKYTFQDFMYCCSPDGSFDLFNIWMNHFICAGYADSYVEYRCLTKYKANKAINYIVTNHNNMHGINKGKLSIEEFLVV